MRFTRKSVAEAGAWWLLVLLTAPNILRADDPQTPAEEYQSLVKAFQAAEQEFFKQYQEAKTDEDRSKLFEKYPVKEFVGRFLEFAEKHPQDATAIDALTWVVQRGDARDPVTADAWNKAVDTLIRQHIENEKIGGVAQSMVYSSSAKAEQFLRAAMERNPHHEVQGTVCMALAQYLKGQVRLAEYLKGPEGDENLERLEKFYGTETMRKLREADLAELTREVESLCTRVIEKYADIKHWRGTLGEAAEGELFEIRNLAIGKVAPDIEGEDTDSEPFKLSDYRGKVLVLDFWGNW